MGNPAPIRLAERGWGEAVMHRCKIMQCVWSLTRSPDCRKTLTSPAWWTVRAKEPQMRFSRISTNPDHLLEPTTQSWDCESWAKSGWQTLFSAASISEAPENQACQEARLPGHQPHDAHFNHRETEALVTLTGRIQAGSSGSGWDSCHHTGQPWHVLGESGNVKFNSLGGGLWLRTPKHSTTPCSWWA